MSSIPGQGTAPWPSKDLKTTTILGNDELMILDSEATTKAGENKRILISQLPSGTGEINNGTNLGSGVGVFKDKVSVNLRFKTLNTEANLIDIAANGDGNTIDFNIGSNVARRDQANDYGLNGQIFRSGEIDIKSASGIGSFVLDAPELGVGQRNYLFPSIADLATDIFVVEAFAQTLTNKTISSVTNKMQGLTLGSTPADNKVVGASTDLSNGSDIALLSGFNTFANALEAPGITFNNAVPADVGAIKAAHIDKIAWRNLANSADLFLEVAFQTPNEFLKFDNRFIPATPTQGTTGQVLISNGLGLLPTFGDPTGSVFPVSDSVFVIEDNADPTKKLIFALESITTGTTRTIISADENVSLVATPDGFIRNSNVEADAQILWNKMEDLPSAQILVGNGIAEATPVAMSGDATIVISGVVTVSSTFAKKTDNLSVFASTTSAQLAGVINDETGTGFLVFNNTPTLVAPNLGTPTLLIGTNVTGISLSTGVIGTLPVTSGGTGVITSTGSGNNVLSTSPILATPNLGTPSVVNLSNGTNLSLTSGVTGVLPVGSGGTGVTTSTGSGDVVLHDSPVLTTPNLGTPSVVNLSNGTNLPLTSGVTGILPVSSGGTGVITSTGTGSVVLSISPTLATPNLGTPSALDATNVTDLPINLGTTGTLTVPRGGTGGTTFTQGGVLIGNGILGVNITSSGNSQEILTSNGVGMDPTFQSAAAAIFPIADNVNLIKGSADATKLLRIEVSANTTDTLGTLETTFTTNKKITLPDAEDTLVGKVTTDTFFNKTYDANGTGNILTNVDIGNLADRTAGQMISYDNTNTPVAVAAGTAGQILVSNGAATPSFQTVFTALSKVFVKLNVSITSPATLPITSANVGFPIISVGDWSISEATNFVLKLPSEGVNEGITVYENTPNILALINYSVSISNTTNTEGVFVELVVGGALIPGSRVNSRSDKNSDFNSMAGSAIVLLNENDQPALKIGAEVISGGVDTLEVASAQYTVIELRE